MHGYPWDLIAGRLVRPFDITLPAPYGYYIACPKPAADQEKVTLFRDWLIAEAASDTEILANAG